jgi:hypothetical protein
MMRLGWIILSASLLFLSACVPAKGTSSLDPFDLDANNATVVAGCYWYFSSRWSPETFLVELPNLRASSILLTGQTIRTSLSGFNAWKQGFAEKDLEFELYEATGIQRITNVDKKGNQINVTLDESVVTIFRLKFPADSEEGTHTGVIVVKKDNITRASPVKIEVVRSGTNDCRIMPDISATD